MLELIVGGFNFLFYCCQFDSLLKIYLCVCVGSRAINSCPHFYKVAVLWRLQVEM